MRLVASTPDSKPVPEAVRGALAAVSPEDLRECVERIGVPRPTGSPENVAVRRTIIEWFSGMPAGRLGVEVDEAGNVVVGDPRRARILVGAHYDSIPGSPGADDNASGVAALLAAARALGPRRASATSPSTARSTATWAAGRWSPGWDGTTWSRSTSWRWSATPAGNRARGATPAR